MSWLQHKIKETEEDHWQREHPWGEHGSVDYWIEAMKRAAQMGETRAQGELDKLVELDGPQPPKYFTDFPDWFWKLWTDHLAPYQDASDHPSRMPY
jgi:hypothetical protein